MGVSELLHKRGTTTYVSDKEKEKLQFENKSFFYIVKDSSKRDGNISEIKPPWLYIPVNFVLVLSISTLFETLSI